MNVSRISSASYGSHSRYTKAYDEGNGVIGKRARVVGGVQGTPSAKGRTMDGGKSELLRGLDRPSASKLGNVSMEGMTEEERKKRINAVRQANTFQGVSYEKDKNGFLKLSSKTDDKLKSPTSKLKYNFKEVSAAIQQAKNSVSASKAAIKAKRKVMELKRALANATDDKDEVLAALNHAKQVERVAKKKQRHLEVEELVESTQKLDEKLDAMSGEQNSTGGFSNTDFIEQAEDVVEDALGEISEKEMEALEDELASGMGSSEMPIEEASVEMPDMEDLAEMAELSGSIGGIDLESVSDLGELTDDMFDEAEGMLEDALDQLGAMEIVDPHMSEEDLKELKIKHRNSERKDLVKADMDYLKATFDALQKKEAALSAQMLGSGTASSMAFFAGGGDTPSGAELVASSVDVAI